MKFYTGATLYKSKILYIGYEDGKRFVETIRYQPYMFVESPPGRTSEWHNLMGKPVERMDFDSIHECREFYKKFNGIGNFPIYGLTNHVYLFLNDEYPNGVQYDPSLISVCNIDIEVAADQGFPSIEEAAKPITAICIKKGGRIVVMGCGDFETDREDVEYLKCTDETALLRVFLEMWNAFAPDVITGWNVEMFDIPYIINRITNVLGFAAAEALSPFGILNDKKFISSAGGAESVRPDILGITILDYLSLYKKFTYSQQESYRLDNIAFVELGERKLDYSEYDGLMGLYKNNHQKFIEYNIKDVEIVDRLDEKLGLLELAYAISYDAKVNLIDAFTSVRMWDIIIHNYLYTKKIVVPQLDVGEKERKVEGAYVKDPMTGMHKWIVSFDLNSLYPHLIMQYNIGPDTYHSHIPERLTVQEIVDGKLDKHRDYLEQNNLSCGGSGACYTKDVRSFLATLMDKMYEQRADFKRQMIELKNKEQQTGETYTNEISKLDNMQMAKKIQLNSAYGALGNNFFRWFDIKYAESITLSGQLSIRWIEKHINKYINKILETENKDYIIACDTDSMYITLDDLVTKTFEGKNPTTSEVISWMDAVASKAFEPLIDKHYTALATYVNAYEQKMHMSREALADKGIWTAKKRYALHVHDMEGVRYKEPFMKIMGMETQRSSVPQICRDHMKAALRMIMEKDETHLMDYVQDFKNKFYSLPFEDIAFPRGVRNLNKYKNSVSLYNKGTPIHVRGSLVYNQMLKDHDLVNVYDPIYEGDKIKFCYLKMPNPARENVIAVATGLPKQLNMEPYLDYEKQFEKSFLEPMRTIAEAIQWKLEKGQATLEDFF